MSNNETYEQESNNDLNLGLKLGLMVALFFFGMMAVSFATDVSDCGTLSTAGDTYVLTTNLTNSSGTCFTINADNVTLDCQGYTLTGGNVSSNYGIYSSTKQNWTVKNCIINNFQYGIYANGDLVDYVMINNVTVDSSSASPIYINQGDYATINNSYVTSSGISSHGIYAYTGANNLIVNNSVVSVSGATAYGIYVRTNSDYATIENTNVTSGAYSSVYVTGSNHATINNVIGNSSTNHGIILSTINHSTISNSVGLSGSNNINIGSIYLGSGTNNSISNSNGTANNGASGIYLYTLDNSNINNCIGTVTSSYGFRLNAVINSVINNSIGTATTSGQGILTQLNTINTSILNSNFTTASGNAIYLNGNTFNSTLNNVIGNATTSGRGLYVYHATNPNDNITITNSQFYSGTGGGVSLARITNSLLENLTVVGGTAGTAISVDSGVNLIINNANTSSLGSGHGLVIVRTNSSNFTNINASSISSGQGIRISTSYNNNLFNVFGSSSSSHGLYLYDSSNNNIINATTTSSSGYGVYLAISTSTTNNNTFNNVTANSTSNYGLYLAGGLNNSFINSSIISGSNLPLALTSINACSDIFNTTTLNGNDLLFYGNDAYDLSDLSIYYLYLCNASGTNLTTSSANHLYLNYNNNSVIYNNSFANSNELVNIDSNSQGNTFYWNNFTNATIFVNDSGTANNYNSSLSGQNEGNIWEDVWNGSVVITSSPVIQSGYNPNYDVGNGGTSYPYNSSSSSQFICAYEGCGDYAPLIFDITPPVVLITSPISNGNVSNKTINITGTSTDTNYNYTNISITQNGVLINSTTTTASTWSKLLNVSSDGIYNITATAWDNNSNYNLTTNVNITVDTTAPVVNITNPIDNQLLSSYNFSVSGLSSDIHYNYTNISVYLGSTLINSTITSNLNWTVNFSVSSDGIYTITATAFDTFGFNSTDSILVRTLDFDYDDYLNIDSSNLADEDCYARYSYNGQMYYYPIVNSSGHFNDTTCKTSFIGFVSGYWTSATASIVENKIYKGGFIGTTQPGSFTINNNQFIYDFATERNLTIYGKQPDHYGHTIPTIVISNGTSSLTATTTSSVNVSFLTNGSICYSGSCIFGYGKPLTMNISISGTTCDSDYDCSSDISFTYMSDWIVNNSITGWNNSQIKYNNSLKGASWSYAMPSYDYSFYEPDTLFWKNNTIEFPMLTSVGTEYVFWINTSSSTYYPATFISATADKLKPEWISYLGSYITGTTQINIYKAYDPSTQLTNMISNTASVIYDEDTHLCYFIPAYAPSNLSIEQPLTGYSVECDALFSYIATSPTIPLYTSCYVDSSGDNYIINITSNFDLMHRLYLTNTSGGVSYSSYYQDDYSASINLNTYPVVNYTINGRQYCYYNDNTTSILGFSNVSVNGTIKEAVIFPLFAFSMALSVVNPFVFILPVIINDVFNLFTIEMVIMMGVMVAILSFVMNQQPTRDIKYSFIIIAVLIAYLSMYSEQMGGIPSDAGNTFESLKGNWTNLESTYHDKDLVKVLISSVDFSISLGTLIIKLPETIVNLVIDSITLMIPMASGVLNVFGSAIKLGAYLYILVKLYEVISNKFQRV
jgi:hypothetical protein